MLFSSYPSSKASHLHQTKQRIPTSKLNTSLQPTTLSVMGWQCCQCSHRSTDEHNSICKSPCNHHKCSWCSITVGKSALLNANARKVAVGKPTAAQQPTAKPTDVKCAHCGKPHATERCWKLYPEQRPKKEKRWCEYCQSSRHVESTCRERLLG